MYSTEYPVPLLKTSIGDATLSSGSSIPLCSEPRQQWIHCMILVPT